MIDAGCFVVRFRCRWAPLSIFLVSVLLSSCATRDTKHVMVVSVKDQKMALYREGQRVATYPVSTSKFGTGDQPRSYRTPVGELEVARKIGDGQPMGMVFKSRCPTGEILSPNAPGRDPIVTRILWLRGSEGETQNAYSRYIYIHGTPEEQKIGQPASYGCVRMASRDIVNLYDTVGVGAKVRITEDGLPYPVGQQMRRVASAFGGAVYQVATLGRGGRGKSS